MTDKPQQPPSYPLRMPQALREHLVESAKKNNRSMNAEIIARLEESYFDHDKSPVQKYTEQEMRRMFEAAAQSVTDMIAEKLESAEFIDPEKPGDRRRLIIRKSPKE